MHSSSNDGTDGRIGPQVIQSTLENQQDIMRGKFASESDQHTAVKPEPQTVHYDSRLVCSRHFVRIQSSKSSPTKSGRKFNSSCQPP